MSVLYLLWRSMPEHEFALLRHLLAQTEDGRRLVDRYFTGTKHILRADEPGHTCRIYPVGPGWIQEDCPDG